MPFNPARSSSPDDSFSLPESPHLLRRPLSNLDILSINFIRDQAFFTNQDILKELDLESEAALPSRLVGCLTAAQYFGHQYETSMDIHTLNKAICCYRTAEEESKGVDPIFRRVALQGLSICLLLRYQAMKDRCDLDETINICCGRPGTNNAHCNPWFHLRVAASYHSRFDHSGDIHDLEIAVQHYHTAISHPFPRKTDYLMALKDLQSSHQAYPEFRSLLLARAREAKLAVVSLDPDETHRLEVLKLLLDLLREQFRQNRYPQLLKEAIAVDREFFLLFWPIWEKETFSDAKGLVNLRDFTSSLPGKAVKLLETVQNVADDDGETPLHHQYVGAWFCGWLRNVDFFRLLLLRLRIKPRHLSRTIHLLSRLDRTRRFRATLCQQEPEPGKPFVFIVSSSKASDEIVAATSDYKEVFPFVRHLTDVRDILSLSDPLPYILEADAVWVPSIMHFLQLELDDLVSPHRKACLKLLRALARKHGLLPPSLFLRNVKRQGVNAIRGGGFADIWKGETSGRLVCLKVLRMFIESDDRSRERIICEFCHEALLWRQLNHPNVLPFLGVSTELFAPGFCLISPWMNNGDIVTFLKNNPHHDRLDAIYEVSKGLAYLHSLSPPIVHGDIRGANILVDDDLRCCLADFGLALAAESQVLASTTGGLRGSVRWIAPELMDRGVTQHQGRPRDKTPRDIYAFGCTTYEILTGKPPFSEQTMEVTVILDVIRGRRPARPTDTWCPDSVWNLIEKSWTQNARERPRASNVRNFLDRLSLLRKRNVDDYRTLEFDDDTSGPIFIDLSDDDECDLQSHCGSDDEGTKSPSPTPWGQRGVTPDNPIELDFEPANKPDQRGVTPENPIELDFNNGQPANKLLDQRGVSPAYPIDLDLDLDLDFDFEQHHDGNIEQPANKLAIQPTKRLRTDDDEEGNRTFKRLR